MLLLYCQRHKRTTIILNVNIWDATIKNDRLDAVYSGILVFECLCSRTFRNSNVSVFERASELKQKTWLPFWIFRIEASVLRLPLSVFECFGIRTDFQNGLCTKTKVPLYWDITLLPVWFLFNLPLPQCSLSKPCLWREPQHSQPFFEVHPIQARHLKWAS